jgi:small subunit ribosomal protein S16
MRASFEQPAGLLSGFAIQGSEVMVRIRLSRGGALKRPYYHIVVTDRRNRRDGRYIERLGFFNPIATAGEERLRVDLARADYWFAHGAKASERVEQLLKQHRQQPAS